MRENKEMVRRLRAMLRAVRRRHGYKGVVLAHVRGHMGHHGNECADRLAGNGLYAATQNEQGPLWLRIFEDGVT